MRKTIQILKEKILHILNRYPTLRPKVIYWLNLLWRFTIKFKTYKTGAILSDTCWIEPDRIEYALIRGFDVCHDRGKVVGGRWDLSSNRIKIQEMNLYLSLYQHFVDGISWRETKLYENSVVTKASNTRVQWERYCEMDLNHRCGKIDELYRDMKSNRYSTQNEIELEDEIAVAIGHDGTFLLTDGGYSLFLARILHLEKIPVRILVRHRKWVGFQKEIVYFATDRREGETYQPLTHPDLFNIVPSDWGNRRFETIRGALSTREGTLLDIGANWGYFCIKFEEDGFHCYAVENDPTSLYFMKRLREIENKKFEIINRSIFEYHEKTDFDVVLALNVWHHFLKRKEPYLQLVELLKILEMRELYLQPHEHSDPQMRGAYRNYHPEEFVEFVLRSSNLSRAELISEEGSPGRPIYKLSRSSP